VQNIWLFNFLTFQLNLCLIFATIVEKLRLSEFPGAMEGELPESAGGPEPKKPKGHLSQTFRRLELSLAAYPSN